MESRIITPLPYIDFNTLPDEIKRKILRETAAAMSVPRDNIIEVSKKGRAGLLKKILKATEKMNKSYKRRNEKVLAALETVPVFYAKGNPDSHHCFTENLKKYGINGYTEYIVLSIKDNPTELYDQDMLDALYHEGKHAAQVSWSKVVKKSNNTESFYLKSGVTISKRMYDGKGEQYELYNIGTGIDEGLVTLSEMEFHAASTGVTPSNVGKVRKAYRASQRYVRTLRRENKTALDKLEALAWEKDFDIAMRGLHEIQQVDKVARRKLSGIVREGKRSRRDLREPSIRSRLDFWHSSKDNISSSITSMKDRPQNP